MRHHHIHRGALAAATLVLTSVSATATDDFQGTFRGTWPDGQTTELTVVRIDDSGNAIGAYCHRSSRHVRHFIFDLHPEDGLTASRNSTSGRLTPNGRRSRTIAAAPRRARRGGATHSAPPPPAGRGTPSDSAVARARAPPLPRQVHRREVNLRHGPRAPRPEVASVDRPSGQARMARPPRPSAIRPTCVGNSPEARRILVRLARDTSSHTTYGCRPPRSTQSHPSRATMATSLLPNSTSRGLKVSLAETKWVVAATRGSG